MRVLVLGAKGMLGSMVTFIGRKETSYNIFPFTRNEFDVEIDSIEKLDTYIVEGEKIWVINCIGAIPQKKPTDEQYTLLNEKFPHRLASWCKSKDVKLIHVSTNCVFSGKHPYLIETDIPDEEDIYGSSKAKGEPFEYGLTLRCSIIGPEVEGRVSGLMAWFFAQEGTIQGYTDHTWNGLTTLELARTIFYFIERNYENQNLLHLWSNTVSKYELLCMLQNKTGKQIEIQPVAKGEKHYTLKSLFTVPKSLNEQLDDLFKIKSEYDKIYN